MRDQHDLDRQLDDLLDALTAGQSPAAPDNPELAALVDTARRIRELGRRAAAMPDVTFPSTMAASLGRELRSDMADRSSAASMLALASDGANGGAPPTNDARPIPPPERPRWLPEALRLVAAIAAFAVAGLVFALVLRGSDGASDSRTVSSGSPPPTLPCLVPLSPGVQPSNGSIAYIADGSIDLAPLAGTPESLASMSLGETDAAWHMAWSPDGRTLAYSSGGRIYLVEPGSEPRRLTTQEWESAETSPAWSPDGKRIAFVVNPAPSGDPDSATENADLFVADVATGAIDRLTDTPGDERDPVWTANRRWVMYARSDGTGATDTWMIDVDNLDQHKMLAGVAITSDTASLSPDGCTVAWVDELTSNLLIAPAASLGPDAPPMEPRILVGGSDQPVMFVSWTPDGSRLLYTQITVRYAGGETDFQLRTIAPGSSDSRVIASLAAAKPMPPVWSPDGGRIAFAIWDYRSGTQELRIVKADGSDMDGVTDRLERGAVFPAWRPGTAGASSDQPPGQTPPPASPTPDDTGLYRLSTFAEARQIAPYPLVEPAVGEYGIELNGITVHTDPMPPGSVTGQVRDVVAHYDYGGEYGIEFHQRRGSCGDTGMVDPESRTLTLGGKDVEETRGTNVAGLPLVVYQWQTAEICYMVFGAVPNDLAQKRVQQLAEAVPMPPSQSEAAPTATPATPDNRALLTTAPDFGTPDTSVILRGRGFMPETSVAIFGGPLSGERRGSPVLDTMVASDGTFSVMLDPATLRLACPDALPDQSCRLSAVPGSMTTIVDTDAPSAFTVYTFAEWAPAEVLERAPLPSCGVDIALNDPSWDAGAGQAARECLIAAVDAGLPAELTYLQQTVEGDFVISIYRLNSGGVGEIYIDSTRDRFSAAGWTVATCEAPVTDGRQPGGLVFSRCGEPTPIE